MKKKDLIDSRIENIDMSSTDVQIKFFEKIISGMHDKYKRARELNLPMKTVEDRLKAVDILKEDQKKQDLLEIRLKKRLQNYKTADFKIFAGEYDNLIECLSLQFLKKMIIKKNV